MRREFVAAALADTQAIIRGLDTKTHIQFLVLLGPLTLLVASANWLGDAWRDAGMPERVAMATLFAIVAVAWLFAVLNLLGALVPRSDPAHFIIGSPATGGGFYAADLYYPARRWFRLSRERARMSLDEHLARMPTSDEQFERELALEQMKLVFIRESKVRHLRRAVASIGTFTIALAALFTIAALV